MDQNVFRIHPQIYYGPDSARILATTAYSKALIVTDPFMVKSGMLDKVLSLMKGTVKVFSDITPDPDVSLVSQGVNVFLDFCPDLLVAFGGGSTIDASKSILHYASELTGNRSKVQFFAIPTTSGTGSEVTNFSVITMDGEKKAIVNDTLLPDVAILDATFTLSVPPKITADTGIDVLSHALEAYASTKASNCSDAFAEKAISLIFDYLPCCVRDGKNKEARSHLHDASCIAGMAFTNAGLGINHSLAHGLGGTFHIPHGRANAILLPQVIAFNATSSDVAKRYAKISLLLGLHPIDVNDGVSKLIMAVTHLLHTVGITPSIADQGVSLSDFEYHLPSLCRAALADKCTATNPIQPTLADVSAIYQRAYGTHA